ncbi:MAG TPA: hypothetical protein VGB15_03785 [Longimicrobium sp.]|jgi:hypothetical protein
MSTAPQRRTLWRDEARRRFYLVPDGVELAAGVLVLRSGASRRISVDEAAAAPYEVSKDEARAFLDAKLDGFVGGVKRSVEDTLAKLGIPPAPAASPPPPRGSAAPADDRAPSAEEPTGGAAPPAEPGPGVRLFAELVGEAPERVGDPEVFLRSLRTLGDHAAELARQAAQGEEGKAAARARLHALADTLRAHGLAVPDRSAGSKPSGTDAPPA